LKFLFAKICVWGLKIGATIAGEPKRVYVGDSVGSFRWKKRAATILAHSPDILLFGE